MHGWIEAAVVGLGYAITGLVAFVRLQSKVNAMAEKQKETQKLAESNQQAHNQCSKEMKDTLSEIKVGMATVSTDVAWIKDYHERNGKD